MYRLTNPVGAGHIHVYQVTAYMCTIWGMWITDYGFWLSWTNGWSGVGEFAGIDCSECKLLCSEPYTIPLFVWVDTMGRSGSEYATLVIAKPTHFLCWVMNDCDHRQLCNLLAAFFHLLVIEGRPYSGALKECKKGGVYHLFLHSLCAPAKLYSMRLNRLH